MTPSNAKVQDLILDATFHRETTTARRALLLHILRHERYLTKKQLMERVKFWLGRNCFGTSSGEDIFYRDMSAVKQAFMAEGHTLVYSRRKDQPGYYLAGQPALSPELQRMLYSSVTEVDSRQIEIYQRLTPADRFRQACSLSDTARNVVAFRIRQENPDLSLAEANQLALERAYKR